MAEAAAPPEALAAPVEALAAPVEALAASAEPLPAHASNKRPRSIFPGSGAVHFSTRGEYGVRMMVELARHHGAGPISLAEMADHENLPRPYLEQLVVSLREQGLVHSTRGAHGGYQLSREPAEIRMGEVLRALEGPIAPMICASEDPSHAGVCDRTGFCYVNHLWLTVRNAISARARLHHPRRPGHATATPPLPLAPDPGRGADTRIGAMTNTLTTPTIESTAAAPSDQGDRTLVIRDLHVVPIADPQPRDPARHRPRASARARSTRSWAATGRARRRSPTR